MNNKKDKMDEWLSLMSDVERADVIKSQISEIENTKCLTIQEQEETKRFKANSDIQLIRGLALVTIVIVAACLRVWVIAR